MVWVSARPLYLGIRPSLMNSGLDLAILQHPRRIQYDMLRIGKQLLGTAATLNVGKTKPGFYVFDTQYQGTDYQFAIGADKGGVFVWSWYPTGGDKTIQRFENPNPCS